MSLGIDAMTRMLNRLRPIREIQEAQLTAAQIPAPAGYYNWTDLWRRGVSKNGAKKPVSARVDPLCTMPYIGAEKERNIMSA